MHLKKNEKEAMGGNLLCVQKLSQQVGALGLTPNGTPGLILMDGDLVGQEGDGSAEGGDIRNPRKEWASFEEGLKEKTHL